MKEQTRWTPKRLLSLLLALVMLLGMMPTAVFAADNETKEWDFVIFKPLHGEPEVVANATWGNIGSTGAQYFLDINIDPNTTYKPRDSVRVKAIATLKNVDASDVAELKATIAPDGIGNAGGESVIVSNKTTATLEFPTLSSSRNIKVGLDGSISFWTGITYNVTIDGTPYTDTISVPIKVTNLWPGYNVTYTKPDGANFTGSIAAKGGKDHTYAGKDQYGNIIQTYKVPADAGAEQDGYTFEGWYIVLPGSAGTLKRVIDPYKEYNCTSVVGDITLDAVLKKNQEITFDGGDYYGVTGIPKKVQYSQGTRYTITVQDPKLTGYQFAGWEITKDDAGDANADEKARIFGKEVYTINGPITLSAQWTPDDGSAPAGSHKVTFLAGAANVYIPFANTTELVEDGKDYTIPPAEPTREGYTFAGWKSGTTTYQAGGTITKVTEDLTLEAQWTRETVTVTYAPLAANSGVSYVGTPTTSAEKGSDVSFKLKLESGYDPATLHVYANGVELAAEKVKGGSDYQYTFKANASTNITVDAPSKLTYTVTLPIGETIDVSFTNPETASKSATVAYDGSAAFTVKARNGYAVKGVYVNGVKQTNSQTGAYALTGIQENKTVTVDVEAVQFHKVTYIVNDRLYYVQDVQDGMGSTVEAPKIEGYEFVGWYTKQEGGTPAKLTNITADTVVYAKFTANTYTITYDANRGAFETGAATTQSKTHGQAVTLNGPIPTREGWNFLGWSALQGATEPSYVNGDQYSTEGTVTLYAVWQQKTYTITFSSGEGYSIHYGHASTTVAHGGSFDFNLIVDRDYAENEPKVWKNTNGVNSGDPVPTNGQPTTTNLDGSKKYHYTLSGITENIAINVDVRSNTIYTVTFLTNGSIYQTQQVGYNEKATRPVDPEVEGYEFKGWYKEATCENLWNFVEIPAVGTTPAVKADTVTENTTIYAKLTPITPAITRSRAHTGTGWETTGWSWSKGTHNGSVANGGEPFSVDYGANVLFTLNIKEGFDGSGATVSVNGTLLQPYGDATTSADGKTTLISYKLTNVTVDSEIVVSGIVRKEIKVTYYANATDDVEHLPGQQTLKYYLKDNTDNGTLDSAKPTRVGYEFKGWSTDPETDPDATNAKLYQPGDAHDFVTDTNLYAIWKATATNVTLAVSGLRTNSNGNQGQYEGKDITLTATITKTGLGTPGGSMRFYKTTIDGTNVLLETVPVTGTTVTLTTAAGEFINKANWTETYWAEYYPEEGKGFATSESNKVAVRIWSTAISWSISGTSIAPNGDVLTVYENKLVGQNNTKGGKVADGKMIAGNVYWLEIPTVLALNGGDDPTIGHGYEIKWEYMDDSGSWREYTTTKDSNLVMIDADHSRYSFRANVVPTDPFTKAVDYDETGKLLDDKYNNAGLYTKQTEYVALQDTTTTLAVTNAETEEGNVYINGTQPFGTVGSHLAQFEDEKVTLTATVKDAANTAVTKGYVDFYRDGETTPMNAAPIAIGQNGTASYEATTSKFFDEAINAKDTYYAVYLANDTYATSSSKTAPQTVYIKSTVLAQPVLHSVLVGKRGGAPANTTAGGNLTELLAGVQHTFSLVETGAQTKVEGVDGQFSVVAEDGRTVDADNYTVEWLKTTGSNEQKLDVAENAKKINVDDNKVDDKYRIKLVAKNHMTAGALSKYAVIGTKQNVKVTVSASEDWVYQRNEITLTAEVAAAGEDPTMQPAAGDAVSFYYEDNGAWVKLGSATLTKDSNQSGKMLASITTKELPVTATTNVKRDVVITAVYEGNDTFNESAKVTKLPDTTYKIEPTVGCDTTNKAVTVYSSVVYVTNKVENKTVTVADKTHNSGIYIFAEDDTVLANEVNVNLKLSEVYTLDHNDDKSKLAYGTDYTVQWQKLTNAAAYPDKAADTTPWTNIASATGTTCQIKAEQGAAYRAVITVNDTPIAKGSYTEFQQEIPGRKVYYSNILVAANAPATLTVNVNTSNTGKGYEGIVEGEKVTIHTFTSGATGTTPISKLTVNVYPGKPAEVAAATTPVTPVFTAEKADVNGHVSFDWSNGVTPGYYTLKVKATFTNGYDDKEITRTLIVRDKDYQFKLTGENAVYNGKTQGLNVEVQDMDIESAFAQKSVVVYYYTDEARTQQVEPTQAGTYYATVRLQESAYWTEKSIPATFTIQPRAVEVVDLVAQAKVYDGTTDADIQEIILNDATVDSATGLPNGSNGIIDGDSVYAVGTGYTSQATAGSATLGVKDVTLMGDDAANYTLTGYNYTEELNIQRSQVKGAIINSSYLYTGKNITIEKNDQNVYLIDQAGTRLTPAEYEITYYYHNGDAVEQVPAMNKLGKYTVIARPEQNNYKGGAEQTVYVVSDNATVGTLDTSARSALLHISDTVKVYDGQATGVGLMTTKGSAVASYYYNARWQNEAPTNAGRYLVKVTATNDGVTDTAYGIFTVVKARPQFNPTTKASMEYTSGRYDGTVSAGFVDGKSDSAAETYVTYTGGTIQGVAYEAPTEVGKYIATVHVGETANYTAHEERVAFEITPKALTITADDISRQQYGAYPDLTASFDGLATGGVAADTSLRDVQIQPELIDDSNYTNDASDQVGKNYSITAVAALARNYDVSYFKGNMAVTREDPKPYLEIRGMIENGDGATNLAYYGDVIQLYAYGNQSKTTTGDVHNTSSVLAWSVGVGDPATITQDGLLTVKGVGTVTVTLKRGIGAQQISTTLTFEAKKQEVKVVVPDLDKVYDNTVQDYTSAKTLSAVNAMGIKVFSGNTRFVITNNTRSDVGSQIVTGKVSDSIHSFQSETYGGLFTINVKDVQVWPTEASTTYGAPVTGLTYTEVTPAGSDKVLTDGKAVSLADVYGNLDVLDGYEILVAGRENENYNVQYVTDQRADDVKVTEKLLTVATGTLDAQTGMTSGSLNPAGKFPVNGKDVEPSATMGGANVRMYGEPNWVMDFTLTSLIQGDTLADLVKMAEKLVDFPHDIAADANVKYDARTTFLPSKDKYDVVTDTSMMAFKNYDETYTLGTQNVYQRPVTLKLREGLTKLTAYAPEILSNGNVTDAGKAKLLELLLNNLVVDKYNGEGGLAELLKHTIEDLKIQIDTITNANGKLTLKLKLGNLNYWLDPGSASIDIDLVSTKIVPVYSTLDWTNFTVTMYDETKTHPVNVIGNVRFFIYQKKAGVELKYSNYKNDTIIRSDRMTPTGRTGQYLATFSRLPAGEYAIFAIAENYTIVE